MDEFKQKLELTLNRLYKENKLSIDTYAELMEFADPNQALQLQQTGVSTCFLEDYIDDLFGNKITYKQTSCCKIAPISNENYCPNCGNLTFLFS